MDAGDSTAFMRLASASSVVGAERLRDRDFFGLLGGRALALGKTWAASGRLKSEFSFSTNLMSRSARRPSSDAFRDLKNQSKLNLRGNQPMSRGSRIDCRAASDCQVCISSAKPVWKSQLP